MKNAIGDGLLTTTANTRQALLGLSSPAHFYQIFRPKESVATAAARYRELRKPPRLTDNNEFIL
jgi:hypothetical protein